MKEDATIFCCQRWSVQLSLPLLVCLQFQQGLFALVAPQRSVSSLFCIADEQMSGSALVKRETLSSEKQNQKQLHILLILQVLYLFNKLFFSPSCLPPNPFRDIQKKQPSVEAYHHKLTHLKC